jgi:hypothetical protein
MAEISSSVSTNDDRIAHAAAALSPFCIPGNSAERLKRVHSEEVNSLAVVCHMTAYGIIHAGLVVRVEKRLQYCYNFERIPPT